MSVKNRLKIYIKYKGYKISEFEKLINVSNGYVNSISKGIGGEILLKILESNPNLNINWLLTGEGQMLKENSNNNHYSNIVSNENILCQRNSYEEVEQLKQRIEDLEKIIETQNETINSQKLIIEILKNPKHND